MVGTNCGGDQPEITLTAIDCPVDDIEIDVRISKRREPSRTTTTVNITITCDGDPVNEAEIHVDFWGLFSRTAKTDEEGKLSVSQVTQACTAGLEVTVTVEGQDGEREVVVEPVPE
jgi:hypothetical protein